ncbi:MAG: hypothetical protein AB7D43_03070 [Sulfurimonadaceae bacterium]
MKTKSINRPIVEIAEDTGLHKAEISLALNGKRLLNRKKLLKIVEANYPLEPFVFGKSYLQKEDTKKSGNTTATQGQHV